MAPNSMNYFVNCSCCLFILCLTIQTSLGVDVHYSDILLERLAFGSCFKQGKPEKLSPWPVVQKLRPQAWLWTGDAVYAENHSIAALQNAYDIQVHNSLYQELVSSGVVVDGTWDDHDLGVNDAGKEIDNIDKRQPLFLDFLASSGSKVSVERRERKGVYRSMIFGEGTKTVKIILLDTRTFRDLHIIPSIGASCAKIPVIGKMTPMLASAIRWFASTFGITSLHGGDMLGETQWEWLEEELRTGDEAFTVVVSSVQVLTSAPVFESWSHFPVSQNRLLQMFKKYSPKGLVLLSGDVHFAELLSSAGVVENIKNISSCDEVVEVTSSGLTHSCLSSTKTMLFCHPVLYFYNMHRLWKDSFYLGRNFGSIDIDWSVPKLTARLHDAVTGEQLMTVERLSCPLSSTATNGNGQQQSEL